ncbi:hypothetical protein P4V39_12825 [Brevibacillus borstelensis]|uniref:hypothetical protein n=1 Tax=Brevibacillus borstelensis TaxID=45462 RepID=UPI002E24915E|nr:hypothetical protein [Brevibacillus borstelensis]
MAETGVTVLCLQRKVLLLESKFSTKGTFLFLFGKKYKWQGGETAAQDKQAK